MPSFNDIHDKIVNYLSSFNSSDVGLTIDELCGVLELSHFQIKDALDFLLDGDVIRVDGGRYYYNDKFNS